MLFTQWINATILVEYDILLEILAICKAGFIYDWFLSFVSNPGISRFTKLSFSFQAYNKFVIYHRLTLLD